MRVIIQDVDTQKYLASDETWTDNLNAAKDFRFRPRAFDALRIEHARGLRVIYHFEDLDYSIGARSGRDRGCASLCAAA